MNKKPSPGFHPQTLWRSALGSLPKAMISESDNKRDDNKKSLPKEALHLLVARTGFEPVISALRGRRPKPLDERASMWAGRKMAGMEGFEPPLTEPESVVLPLDDIPIGVCPVASWRIHCLDARNYFRGSSQRMQA